MLCCIGLVLAAGVAGAVSEAPIPEFSIARPSGQAESRCRMAGGNDVPRCTRPASALHGLDVERPGATGLCPLRPAGTHGSVSGHRPVARGMGHVQGRGGRVLRPPRVRLPIHRLVGAEARRAGQRGRGHGVAPRHYPFPLSLAHAGGRPAGNSPRPAAGCWRRCAGSTCWRPSSPSDPAKLGVQGVSWGGYLCWIVNGLDSRIRVSVPGFGVGGEMEDWGILGDI